MATVLGLSVVKNIEQVKNISTVTWELYPFSTFQTQGSGKLCFYQASNNELLNWGIIVS